MRVTKNLLEIARIFNSLARYFEIELYAMMYFELENLLEGHFGKYWNFGLNPG